MSTLYGFQMLARKARSQLVLLEYFEDPHPRAIEQLKALQQRGQADSYGGEGSALAYVSAVEALASDQYAQAQQAVNQLLAIAEREGSLWLNWHALDLQRKIHQAQGEVSLKDQVVYEDCLRKIRQMIPKDMRSKYKLEQPPLAMLV